MTHEINEWRIIRNRDLKLSDVTQFNPEVLDVDAPQWDAFDHFAVSFDGYALSGLGPEFDLLASGVREHVPAGGEIPIRDLSWLWALLFIQQRAMRAGYSGRARSRPEQAAYVNALLQSIQAAIPDLPEPIATGDLRASNVPEPDDAGPSEPIQEPSLNFPAICRFARKFDASRYFGVEDVHGIVAAVANSIRAEYGLAGAIPDVGNLGVLRACLAYEERRWCTWDEDARSMSVADQRYLAALVRTIRQRVM